MKRLMLVVILVLIVAAMIVLTVLLGSPERTKPSSELKDETPAQETPLDTPVTQRVEIMPLDEKTLELFQEANSRAMEQHSDLPYPVAASVSLRKAITDLGHDPDKTLLSWLSMNPADLSTSRSIGNLLSIALGDNAIDEEFADILKQLSPEVRTAALERREKK